MKKILLSVILIITLLISSIAVMAATDILTIEVQVGKFNIYFNDVLEAGTDSNFYWNEEKEEFLPLTMVYKDKIYVPIELLNNNIEYTYTEADNSLYLNTIKPREEIYQEQQDFFIKEYNRDYESNAVPEEQIQQVEDSLVINEDEIKFKPEDFGFSQYSTFKVGSDTISKFYSFYSTWIKHSTMIDQHNHKITFYDLDDYASYHTWDVITIYNIKSEVVKDITFMEWQKNPKNAVFNTNRGINTDSTIKDVIKAYGKKYTIETIEDGNGFEMTILTYRFYADSEEMGKYTKGAISFYTYKGESLENSLVTGMRLRIN